jgi:NADP-dependent 3-hydroxy acid dehydrogenase YdfG
VLTGRVAVVTGAPAGIGAGLAAMLAAEGATVVLAARRETALAGVADGIRQRGGVAIPVLTDLTSDESIARLLATAQAEAGPVDVLVNNAGYAVWKPLEETTSAEWDHAFAVNVRAAARLSAGVQPGMQARRFGRIINIASEAGVAIVPGLAAYCVAKHALVALTEVIQDGNHDNGIKACQRLSALGPCAGRESVRRSDCGRRRTAPAAVRHRAGGRTGGASWTRGHPRGSRSCATTADEFRRQGARTRLGSPAPRLHQAADADRTRWLG